MTSLELLRRQTLHRLQAEYASGHLRTGTLEQRVAAALAARTPAALEDVTWDVPSIEGSLWQGLRSLVRRGLEPHACSRLVFRSPRPLTIELDEEPRSWLVGRSGSCDVVLRDPHVSRRHALLSSRGSLFAIRDLDSTNGLLVNDRRVRSAQLQPGDVITFGRLTAFVG